MRWPQSAMLGLVLLLVLPGPGGSAGAADEPRFAVRNAFVELAGDSWHLGVSLDLGLTEGASLALDEGIPLTVRLEAEALSRRRLLPNEKVATAGWQWQIEYDALASRYVITDPGNVNRDSYASRDEALAALARPSGLLLADAGQLPPDERFDVRVRAVIEVGELPAAVRMLLFWRSFSEATEWYTWTVRP